MMLPLLATVTAVTGASLAAGFRVRAQLAAALAARADVVPGGPPAPARGRPRGWSWRSLGPVLLRPYRRVIVLASWLMLAETVFTLAGPWPLKVIVDHGLGHQPLPGWLGALDGMPPVPLAATAAAAGVVLLAAAALLGYLVSYLLAAVSEQASRDLRLLVMDHLMRIPPACAARYPLGELAARAGPDAARVADTVVTAAEVLIPETTVLVGMVAITTALDWRLTLVALAVVPLLATVARARNRGVRAAQHTSRGCAGAVSAQTTALLGRLPAIHVFDRADTEIAELGQLTARSATASMQALDASIRFGPVTELLPGVGLAATLVAGTIEINAGRLTVGGLLVFLAYLSSLAAPVRALVRLTATVSRGEASRQRLAELFAIDAPHPAAGDPAAISPVRASRPPSPRIGPAARGAAIELDAVTFTYHPGQAILNAADLSAEPGDVLCLTGPSGSGKSTLLALLIRLLDPASGRIRIAGQDISAIPLHQLRRLVAIVPQDPWLHRGSIAANIAYGRPAASPDDIRRAAAQAGAHQFIRLLPGLYDTDIGEQGHALSGGQARRIAIARALLRNCPVLLLDEPTAGLDAGTETDVLAHLMAATRGSTLLIVSHQPRIMAMADRVLTLDGGRIGSAPAGPRNPITTAPRRR